MAGHGSSFRVTHGMASRGRRAETARAEERTARPAHFCLNWSSPVTPSAVAAKTNETSETMNGARFGTSVSAAKPAAASASVR